MQKPLVKFEHCKNTSVKFESRDTSINTLHKQIVKKSYQPQL